MKKLLIVGVALCLTAVSLLAKTPDTVRFERIGEGEKTAVYAGNVPEFMLFAPHKAGHYRFGIVVGERSEWLTNPKNVLLKKGKSSTQYTVTSTLLGKGKIVVKAANLSQTAGYILNVTGENIPQGTKLVWAYGGQDADYADTPANHLFKVEPPIEHAFSAEVNAITIYYGKESAFTSVKVLTPLDSDIHMADFNRMDTPAHFLASDKKTDTQVICGANDLKDGQPLYFTVFKSNAKADYDYYMLSDLFNREFSIK